MSFYTTYLSQHPELSLEPYLSAEDILRAMEERSLNYSVQTICNFTQWIDKADVATMETYLNQNSLRPDPLSLSEWCRNREIASFLERAFDCERGGWHFEQRVALIAFRKPTQCGRYE